MPRPDLSRVPVFYHNYINQVPDEDLLTAFQKQTMEFTNFIATIPKEKYEYRYAEGKWTVKELLQHIIDAERIFCYRALRFARKDETPLPGFEENDYVINANTDERSWGDLVEEFKVVRLGSELLFKSFNDEQLNSSGTANGNPIYVLGIGFIVIGHSLHHMNILKERYL